MRRPSLKQLFLCTCLTATIVLVGCESTPKAKGSQLHSAPDQPDPQPRQARDPGPSASQMQELLGRLQTLEIDNNQLKKKLSDQYMEAVSLRANQIEAQKKPARLFIYRPV